MDISNKLGILIFFCGLWSWGLAEVFTAISDVEPLLNTHREVINNLDEYVKREEKRLTALKTQLNKYLTEHEKAMEDIPNYLGNPINAFTLIKRLTKDLEEIDRKIKIGTDHGQKLKIYREGVPFPTTEDLHGAAEALARLQATYKLDAKELAEGQLNGVTYSSSMLAGDCFELGRVTYNMRNFNLSISWMKESLRKYQEENDDTYSFNEVDIMDYISWSYYCLGDVRSALEWTKKLLAKDPTHKRAEANVILFEKNIAEEGSSSTLSLKSQPVSTTSGYNVSNYEALCRGDFEVPHEISKKLTCFYLTENHPFLRLAPIKAEKLYADPDAYLFYDVISDEEVAHVKEMAQPKLRRAVVNDPVLGELVPAQYRISKSTWLKDEESPVVARITQRVADFTGLKQDTAEELQVANYGIGGHYEPHYDFVPKSDTVFQDRLSDGNRIATVLFYMSEVAQGGATVFTELGLSVFPVKNAALFWLNLHPSGEGDISTQHAACPVLRGSKWVSNKWIHQGGQEFLKPCSLEYQPEEMVRKIPSPVPKAFKHFSS